MERWGEKGRCDGEEMKSARGQERDLERERTLREVEGEDLETEKSWGSGELPERMSTEKVEELQMAVRGGERDELGKVEELAGEGGDLAEGEAGDGRRWRWRLEELEGGG